MDFMVGLLAGLGLGGMLGGVCIWELLTRDAIKNGVAGYDRDGTLRWVAVQKDKEGE